MGPRPGSDVGSGRLSWSVDFYVIPFLISAKYNRSRLLLIPLDRDHSFNFVTCYTEGGMLL